MAVEVRLPQLAASMADGVISKWLKQVGDPVKRGEPLFEVESDKVTTEVESPADGIVRQIRVGEGQKVDVGTVLAVIGSADEAVAGTNGGARATAAAPATATGSGAPSVVAPAAPPEKIFVTPRARKVADELGIDVTRIRGTGPGGRILERDVLAVAASTPAVAPPAPPSPPPTPVAPPARPAPTPAVVGEGRVLPFAGMRRTIAERMLRSQQTVPEVTITAEVDVGEIVKLREHPTLNSSLTDEGIRLHADVHVGLGVALDDGLIVPVIRHADQKSLVEIAQAIRDLSERARKNQLKPDDVGGSTFTISNMGMLGVESFTPIINWPECAILGVGRVAERAVVRDGQIVARPTLWLSLTFDHRIVDGAPAARFLSRVRQLLESPYLLLV